MKTEKESLKSQVDRLAKFILENCEGYPNKNEGAIDCAIRIIKASTPTTPERVTDEEIEKEANDSYLESAGEGLEIAAFIDGFKQAITRTALPREGENK